MTENINGTPPADADERWDVGPCDLPHGSGTNTAFIGVSWLCGNDKRTAITWSYLCGCEKSWIKKPVTA